ncbi:VOC family protein [Sphingomonas crocodyli]|uniref:VOC family protein n=1 Tax=Sphingomonas crocodyli TaxID=1979270 RepID=A0A437M698_9SPHN|nr:VOC family protein [Sphingomonas crocodyli]RVT93202.1 VOC family protein [Sphingomonas crocodyli]
MSAVAGLRPTLARMSLWTGDADRLAAFYADLFGFELVARSTLRPEMSGAWYLETEDVIEVLLLRAPRGDTELGVSAVKGRALPQGPTMREAPLAGSAYLVLYVPDLDAVIAKAQAADCGFNRAPKRLSDPQGRVYYEMAIYDPDGRVLLVVEDVV